MLHIDRDLLRKISVRDRSCDLRNITHLPGQIPAIKFTLSVRSIRIPNRGRMTVS